MLKRVSLSEFLSKPLSRFHFPGKAVFLLILSILVWGSFLFFLQKAEEVRGRLELQEKRFMDLLVMADEYRSRTMTIIPGDGEIAERDPMTLISEALDVLSLKQNLVQMSATSSGVTLQLRNLYGGQMMNLLERISRSGLSVESTEIKAVNTDQGRMLDISVIVVKRS
ncbi:MAG: hypothetical protein JW971_01775 [Synergistales bacterium]|nr:hypothetical protein [Synergistales bacterium]